MPGKRGTARNGVVRKAEKTRRKFACVVKQKRQRGRERETG